MEFVYSKEAARQFKKLDLFTQKKIKAYTDELEALDNPRVKGKGLVANLSGYWRYRIENYRLICKIQDNEMIILCLEINKRDKVYK